MSCKRNNQLLFVVILFGLIFLNVVCPSYAKNLITTDKALGKIYPKATYFDAQKLVLSDAQIKTIEEKARISFEGSHSRSVLVYTAKKNDQILGFALEDTVIGKWGPIHYLVGINIDGTILQVIILDYQEIRGRPIAKKRFLRQYQKKNIYNPIKLRKDIDGVTGATISSRSLTNGIRKLLFIFQEFRVTIREF